MKKRTIILTAVCILVAVLAVAYLVVMRDRMQYGERMFSCQSNNMLWITDIYVNKDGTITIAMDTDSMGTGKHPAKSFYGVFENEEYVKEEDVYILLQNGDAIRIHGEDITVDGGRGTISFQPKNKVLTADDILGFEFEARRISWRIWFSDGKAYLTSNDGINVYSQTCKLEEGKWNDAVKIMELTY